MERTSYPTEPIGLTAVCRRCGLCTSLASSSIEAMADRRMGCSSLSTGSLSVGQKLSPTALTRPSPLRLVLLTAPILSSAAAVSVRVMGGADGRCVRCDGAVERLDSPCVVVGRAASPADNASGEEIKTDSEVGPSLKGPEAGQVRRSACLGTRCRGRTFKDVRCRWYRKRRKRDAFARFGR